MAIKVVKRPISVGGLARYVRMTPERVVQALHETGADMRRLGDGEPGVRGHMWRDVTVDEAARAMKKLYYSKGWFHLKRS